MTVWQKKIQGNIWLVHIEGRLDHQLTPSLETHLHDLLQEDGVQLIVDLSKTNYINSGGMRILVTAWRKAHQQNGDLLLCGLNGRLQEIFSMIGFDKLFDIYANPESAQQYLRKQ